MLSVLNPPKVEIGFNVHSRTRIIFSSTVWFSVLSVLPKVLSLVKDVVVAAKFGAGQALDIYLMALVLIGVPVSIIAVSMQTTLISALASKDANDAAGLLGGAIKFAVVLLILALPIWLVLLPIVLNTLYPNLAEVNTSELLVACLWLIPFYFTNGVNLLLYGALQARKVFWPNAVLPGLFPLSILITMWLIPDTSIRSLLIGTVAGSLCEGFVLLFISQRNRMLRLWQNSGVGLMSVVRLALPLMVGGVIASFSPVVEQLLAFRLGPGAVSLLSYGNKLPAAMNSLLLTAIGVIVLPHFSELMAERQWGVCRKLYLHLSVTALVLGILIVCVGSVLADVIIRLFFERGAFTAANTREVAVVMCVYLLQLPFLLVAMISIRALVAMRRTLIMTSISTAQLILAGSLAFLFSSHYGVVGVALGTTVAVMLGTGIFVAMAWYRLNEQFRSLAV